MNGYLERIIKEEEDGRTVGALLKGVIGLSGRRIRSLKFTEDGIRMDGKRARTSDTVRTGQLLSVRLSDPEGTEKLSASLPAPEILYEDECLILVNKKAGTVCHPAGGHARDTLANALRAYFDGHDAAAHIHLIGRLDKDTSGLILCAKNALTAERLRRQFGGNGFEKSYLALAAGIFPETEREGEIRLPLTAAQPDENRLVRMIIRENNEGKPAGTRYRVLRQYPDFALLSVRLGTGRTHQIRVHLAALGHPLLGDPLYGDPAVNLLCGADLQRTALHAAELTFRHPFGGEKLSFSAPLPPDIQALLVR